LLIDENVKPDKQILRFVAANEHSVLQFARDLIATPSSNPPGDERAVVERIEMELATLGLPTPERISLKPDRPNLLLRLTGSGSGPSLILNGHTDTKPPGDIDKWRRNPFDPVVDDGMLWGLGSTDMKGAVAAMVYAAAAIAEVIDSVDGELQLLLSADEEGGSAFGVKYLASHGYVRADAALVGEPSGIRQELEYLDFESRGLLCFRVRVYGDQMHSSLSDEFEAANACLKAAELMTKLKQDFLREGTTVNPGVTLNGGVYFGVVPGAAEFGCDIRVPFGARENVMRDEIESWLATCISIDPKLRADVVWESPPTIWIEPVRFPQDHRFGIALKNACRLVLPRPPDVGCFPGATDAPWFVAAGVPTIPAFGPGLLPLAHSPNECVSIDSIRACARIYALSAMEFLSG
jgi:acetylornithine deacetylase